MDIYLGEGGGVYKKNLIKNSDIWSVHFLTSYLIMKEKVLLYAYFTNYTTFDLINSMSKLCFFSFIKSPVNEGVCIYKKVCKNITNVEWNLKKIGRINCTLRRLLNIRAYLLVPVSLSVFSHKQLNKSFF